MPTFDNNLSKEDEGNGIERNIDILFSLKFAVIEKIATGLHFFQRLFWFFMHSLESFLLRLSCFIDELRNYRKFGEIEECLVVTKINTIFHDIHLME